jgi:hypothetical protein
MRPSYDGSEGILVERYMLCLLFEYAATLGLVDVAFIPPAGARRDYHKLWGTDDLLFFSRLSYKFYLPEEQLCLHRDSQALRSVCTTGPMHQRSVSFSCHPHG